MHVGYYPEPLIMRHWDHLIQRSSATRGLLHYSSSDNGSGRLPVGYCDPDLVNEADLNIGDVLPRMRKSDATDATEYSDCLYYIPSCRFPRITRNMSGILFFWSLALRIVG